ncbi:hypothetical protein GA0070216_11529 [Micromonospora matsumotoense]|uniref:Uncharacterized protein n=1 Tax=Micromonospora matsumotoense TaxID=121616 RepID=A0A1C5AA25_9ACTN|nr:hypothetical protein GA0070216_11529 [Micromonospora matsumotoense]
MYSLSDAYIKGLAPLVLLPSSKVSDNLGQRSYQ